MSEVHLRLRGSVFSPHGSQGGSPTQYQQEWWPRNFPSGLTDDLDFRGEGPVGRSQSLEASPLTLVCPLVLSDF